jgi:hypothetical protein
MTAPVCLSWRGTCADEDRAIFRLTLPASATIANSVRVIGRASSFAEAMEDKLEDKSEDKLLERPERIAYLRSRRDTP